MCGGGRGLKKTQMLLSSRPTSQGSSRVEVRTETPQVYASPELRGSNKNSSDVKVQQKQI